MAIGHRRRKKLRQPEARRVLRTPLADEWKRGPQVLTIEFANELTIELANELTIELTNELTIETMCFIVFSLRSVEKPFVLLCFCLLQTQNNEKALVLLRFRSKTYLK